MGSVVHGAFTGAGYRVPQGTDPPLRNYLEERDYGPGTGSPGLLPKVEMQASSGAVLCEVQWIYEQVAPPRGVKIDGFVIWLGFKVGAGEVPEPTVQGAKLSEDARSYAFPVPPGIAMRVGIQTYRNVHQGEFRSPKLWPESWICDNRGACTRVLYHLPFLEAFNNGQVDPSLVTRVFTPLHPETLDPVTIHTVAGVAQATVNFRRTPMPYEKTVDPWEPGVGCWTLDGDGKVKVTIDDAPWPGDFFEVESAVVC